MKTLLTIIATAGICYAVLNRDTLPPKQPDAENAPTAAMEQLVAAFPKRYTTSGGSALRISDVSFDVRKTDSLVNPIVGEIRFHQFGEYRMLFQWKSGKWMFNRLLTETTDITDRPGGVEILDSAEMRPLLAKCGYVTPAPAPPAPPTPEPKATTAGVTTWWADKPRGMTTPAPKREILTDQQRMAEWARRSQTR